MYFLSLLILLLSFISSPTFFLLSLPSFVTVSFLLLLLLLSFVHLFLFFLNFVLLNYISFLFP